MKLFLHSKSSGFNSWWGGILCLLFPLSVMAQFVQQGPKLAGLDALRVSLQGTSVAVSADGKTAVVGGPFDGFTGAAWVYTENNGVWSQQGPKLVGTDGVNLSSQGNSVAISADGNTILVGGPDDNNLTGAAWVFVRNGGVWTQQGPKLVGTGGIGQTAQGVSVSLSADGNTAIIGGSNDNNFRGAAWIFTRNAGVWTQQGSKLVGSAAVGSATQGYAVAISADGNTAIIGGPNDNSYRGAAWIFRRLGNSWFQQGFKIVGFNAIGKAAQGTSVSLSGDGNTAIIGGKHDNFYKGAAWIYKYVGTTWQYSSKLVGTGFSGYSYQGYSVDLSNDGLTAIVGGYGDANSIGAAWVFTLNGSFWSQQGNKLVGSGVTGGYANQGNSVSLSADGNLAFIGGPYDNIHAGAAWVFTRQNSVWTQVGDKLVGSDATGYAYEGYSVAICADGNTALVGGYYENFGEGAVWAFTRSNGVWDQQGTKLVGTGSMGLAAQGYSIDLSHDGNTAIIGGPWDNYDAGAAWIFTRKNGIWTQEGEKLFGSGAIGEAYQGRYVAISGDGNTAVVCGPRDDNNYGAVWIFTRKNGSWEQQGEKIVCQDPTGYPYLGRSADLSYDGNTLVVGGTFDDYQSGAAWVFVRQNDTWTQQGPKLVGSDAVGSAGQGMSVSLSSDGNTLIVGGGADQFNLGAAWVFSRHNDVWSQESGKLIGTGAAPGFVYQGISVAMSGDGNTAVVGGYSDNNLDGAVWAFTRSNGVWSQAGDKIVETGAINNSGFGFAIDLSADGKTFIAGGPWENGAEGAAWIFSTPSCDNKENGCISFELMGISVDPQLHKTYEIRLTNQCDEPLSYVAIGVPDGVTAVAPENNAVYATPAEHSYLVRSPNFSPFYSIRFKAIGENIHGGASDIFRYALPPQADPSYIQVLAKMESGQTIEAYLNVFNCEVNVSNANRSEKTENAVSTGNFSVFPNPTSGILYADLSDWAGEEVVLQLFNTNGKLMQTIELEASKEIQALNMKPTLVDGVYVLCVTSKSGDQVRQKVILKH